MKRQADRNADSGLLELVNDLVMSLSLDGSQLLYINRAAEKIYGRRLAEIYENSTHWIDAIHADDQVGLREGLANLNNSEVFAHEFRVLKPDGDQSWLIGTFSLVPDSDGQPHSIGAIAKDVSRRVATEQRLEVANERISVLRSELQQAQDENTNLSENISQLHDTHAEEIRTIRFELVMRRRP